MLFIPRVVPAFVGVMLVVGSASAQDRSASDGLGSRLKIQDIVTITFNDGRTERGTVEAIAPSSITLGVDTAPRTLDLASVREIRKQGDSLGNGALIGFFSGLGASAVIGGFTTAMCGNSGGSNCPSLQAIAWILPMAVGTGLGVALDASRTGSTLVFGGSKRVSLTPVVGPAALGVSARVTRP
jgi:hypothetical protein